jgi:hypothetical protein
MGDQLHHYDYGVTPSMTYGLPDQRLHSSLRWRPLAQIRLSYSQNATMTGDARNPELSHPRRQ